MERQPSLGMNRTGISVSPIHSQEMIEGSRSHPSNRLGHGEDANEWRRQASREAPTVGSVPVPTRFKGLANAALMRLKGKRAEIFIDKLGERLAFERTGVRLYEQLITRCEALGGDLAPVSIERLRHFRDEEARHFSVLAEVFREIGADPTAETPSADVAGVAGSGVLKVISDPRTTLTDCLNALLIAEATDSDGWKTLIQLANEVGADDHARTFQGAMDSETEHLNTVRHWYNELVLKVARTAA